MARKEKYPDTVPARGVPYEGIENPRPEAPDEPIRYDRVFPFLGEEVINRGTRCKVRQENVKKYPAVLGLNFGFRNGTSVQADFNRIGGGDERVVLSATYKF